MCHRLESRSTAKISESNKTSNTKKVDELFYEFNEDKITVSCSGKLSFALLEYVSSNYGKCPCNLNLNKLALKGNGEILIYGFNEITKLTSLIIGCKCNILDFAFQHCTNLMNIDFGSRTDFCLLGRMRLRDRSLLSLTLHHLSVR